MRSAAGGTAIKGQCAAEPAAGLFPAFSASGQDVWVDAYEHHASAVVLSAVGARCGKTFKADGQWSVVANTHCLFPLGDADRDFLWWLTNDESWWEKGGSAQPFVKVAETLQRKWAFPPLPEQRAIAAFLDRETAKIDAAVAEQERLIELLAEKRQAVISHAVTKGLDPAAPMKPSGIEWLGKVPAHWDVVPCRRLVREQTAKNEGAVCQDYLSLMANVGVLPYEEKGDVGNKKPEDLSKCKLVSKGDFVINSMNYGIGSYGVSNYIGVCSPVYIVLRPIADVVEPRFAFRIFEQRSFQTYAQSFGNGILEHRCAINWDILKGIGVGLAPRIEQMAILNYLDRTTTHYDALRGEAELAIALMTERRSALISAAVTGQIDVRNAAPVEPA
jgi:restriction endonuclease S subunit